MLMQIKNFLWNIDAEKWALAVFSVVLGLFMRSLVDWAFRTIRRLRELIAIQSLLGQIARDDEECVIVLKWMYPDSPRRITSYVSELPPAEASHREDPFEHWINIPLVLPLHDVLAAAELTALLERAKKKNNIRYLSVAEAAEIWDRNIISVGGSFKSGLIANLASPPLAHWSGTGFEFPTTRKTFRLHGTHDLGLILKATHPVSRKTCLMTMGGGVNGTLAAAYHVNRKASQLGALFGKKDFAFLVQVDVHKGLETTEPLYSTTPPWYRKYFALRIWRKLGPCLQ